MSLTLKLKDVININIIVDRCLYFEIKIKFHAKLEQKYQAPHLQRLSQTSSYQDQRRRLQTLKNQWYSWLNWKVRHRMFPRIISNCHLSKIKGHRKSNFKRYSFLKSFQAFYTGNSAKRPCFGTARPLILAFSLSQNFRFSIQHLNLTTLEFCLMQLLTKDIFTAKFQSITKFFICLPPICKHPTCIQEWCINANFQ